MYTDALATKNVYWWAWEMQRNIWACWQLVLNGKPDFQPRCKDISTLGDYSWPLFFRTSLSKASWKSGWITEKSRKALACYCETYPQQKKTPKNYHLAPQEKSRHDVLTLHQYSCTYYPSIDELICPLQKWSDKNLSGPVKTGPTGPVALPLHFLMFLHPPHSFHSETNSDKQNAG